MLYLGYTLSDIAQGWEPGKRGRHRCATDWPRIILMTLLSWSSISQTFTLFSHTGAQYSAIEWTMDKAVMRIKSALATHVERARSRTILTLVLTLSESFSSFYRWEIDIESHPGTSVGYCASNLSVHLFKLFWVVRSNLLFKLKHDTSICIWFGFSFQVLKCSMREARSIPPQHSVFPWPNMPMQNYRHRWTSWTEQLECWQCTQLREERQALIPVADRPWVA